MKKMRYSGIEWIGDIPEKWNVQKIKFLPNKEKNSFIDGDWIDSQYIDDSGIRYYTTGNIGDGNFKEQGSGFISKETFVKLKCKFAYPGDLIFSRLNAPYGRSCILPNKENKCVIAVDNVILRTNNNKKYICYVTQCDGYHDAVGDFSNGATMQRISRINLGNVIIPLPNIKEQQLIANFLDNKVEKIDEIINDLNKQVEVLEKYKKSLITETVTKGLNANVKMKDSGIDWIGKIPEHWVIGKIKYIFNSLNSGTAISNNELREDTCYLVYGGGKPMGEYHKFNIENTIVIGRVGANCGCVTRVYDKAWATDNALVVETKKEMNYIYYLLISMNLNDLNVSTAQPLITSSKIMNVKIPYINNVKEQKEISDYLDKKCFQIDEIIKDKQSQIDKMKKYKKSLIYEYATGKKRVKGAEELYV